MKGIYENKLGVRLEVFETNKDVLGNKYCTWRWCDNDKTYNVRVDSFKEMLKVNHYRKVGE